MVPVTLYQLIKPAVDKYGGYFVSHTHFDRAGTLNPIYFDHVNKNPIDISSDTLFSKQDVTGDLHRGLAYQREDLRERMEYYLNEMIGFGTRRVDSFIDVSSSDDVGLTALDVALELKDEYRDKIDFRVGAYPVFGFKDGDPKRWDLFIEAANLADYLGCLPERDDRRTRPGHIGYKESMGRTLELAIELKKPIQYHVDQANDPREKGTEMLVEAVKWLGSPEIKEAGPSVYAVHVISPSGYEEERFQELLTGLYEQNIGVISCPTAALSMRQLRPLETPTHNSMARVWDIVDKGIPVSLGTDNIADVFLPCTTSNMYDQLACLADSLRFYDSEVLAKIACGEDLNNTNKTVIKDYLEKDKEVFKGIKKNIKV